MNTQKKEIQKKKEKPKGERTSVPSSNNKTLNARLLARVITGCHYT